MPSWPSVVFVAECAVCAVVLATVPYTEVDWRAYMEEVRGFLGGELDYAQLQGGTGPLVYPGGFVLVFSALHYLTLNGTSIVMAQCIFAGVYLATLKGLMRLYAGAGVPAWHLVVLLLSKRIRSLYFLRLFNDCIAMALLYLAVHLIAASSASAMARRARVDSKLLLGCLVFSMAVSVKMNVLLFAPGLLFVLATTQRSLGAVAGCLGVCAAWQVLVGLPFLLHHPTSYLTRGFELSRVFTYKWTVNYKFLPEDVFTSPGFGAALLAGNICAWGAVCRRRWWGRPLTVAEAARRARPAGRTASPGEDAAALESIAYRNVLLTLFESNLIGMVFVRTMHYQFLVWMFHQLPFVLYFTGLPFLLKRAVIVGVSFGFEKYPSSPASSALLMSSMALLLLGVLLSGEREAPARRSRRPGPVAASEEEHVAGSKSKRA